MGTSNSGNSPFNARDDLDWRAHTGVVGHNNVLLFWNPAQERWRPITEASPNSASKVKKPAPTGAAS